MGYTHYWTQKRDFTKAEWETICADLGGLLKFAQHERGIPLADWEGAPRTSPEISADVISFNGLGDDSHETFMVHRRRPAKESWQTARGSAFCKTARKPYDPVVTACLCYLSTITRQDDPATGEPINGTEAFEVSSDGDGSDFLEGLQLARDALPRVANQLDLPMAIMQADRWCPPYVSTHNGNLPYEVRFCVDGKGYVMHRRTGESYCFESHFALAQFLDRNKRHTFRSGKPHFGIWSYGREEPNIWNATGAFDPARHARIARARAKVLARLFPVPAECAQRPPAYVRPGEMPPNGGREFAYDIASLMQQCLNNAA